MKTLQAEIRELLNAAACLPADGKTYSQGDIKSRHCPQTAMKVEHVLVERYSQVFRSRLARGRWQAAEQIAGAID